MIIEILNDYNNLKQTQYKDINRINNELTTKTKPRNDLDLLDDLNALEDDLFNNPRETLSEKRDGNKRFY
jgi:hypothetical protein